MFMSSSPHFILHNALFEQAVCAQVYRLRPAALVVDSIQTMSLAELNNPMGSPIQVCVCVCVCVYEVSVNEKILRVLCFLLVLELWKRTD
jgi:predicted ATP-dependent serine protease